VQKLEEGGAEPSRQRGQPQDGDVSSVSVTGKEASVTGST
jgi:hypothetical protein